MRLLIIDDDYEDIELFREAVSEIFPHAVLASRKSCSDIEACVEELRNQDIIFLDGHLATESGLECLKKLKTVLKDETKIVIHSGSLSPSELEDFKIAGVDEILIKASSYALLKSNLKELLSRKFNTEATP
jgi:response regulator of citrate/malate metabolism